MGRTMLRFTSYILVAALASFCTLLLTQKPNEPAPYSKLAELENLIEERFIEEVDTGAMEDAAAAGMVDSLGDRWSFYLPAAEYAAYAEQMANAYVGIGITISMNENGLGLDVISVSPNSPALEAGILPGDIITMVEGQDVLELGLSGTRDVVRGEEGTEVALTIMRDGKKQDVTVMRKQIDSDVAKLTMLPDGIALIKIENFNTKCAEQTIDCIISAVDQGAKGLLFDLRNNPGGYKNELVKVLDYLLPEGPLFISEDYTGQTDTDYSDESFVDLPMVVLQNEDSYSAGEFFGAALREYGVATIVGTQTVGKGYYQYTYLLEDGSAVGLSGGKYYTPHGVSLAGVGITPDITVEVDDDTFAKIYAEILPWEEDIQILAGIDVLKGTNQP